MPRPLKIAVDVRDLQIARTGTRTYLEELCKEFRKMERDDIRFYFLDTRIPVYGGKNKILKLVEHARYQLWKQLVLPIKAYLRGADIIFCTDNFVPIIHLGYKTIPVFHDAFFFETPQNYGKLWLWLYKKTAIPAAKRSPFVITPSVWSKKQINHYTAIDSDKLVVVYEGPKALHHIAGINEAEKILKQFSLQKEAYLLHVGSMFKRKNIPALIKAFTQVKSSGYAELKLVLAGSMPSVNVDNDQKAILEAITASGLQNDIILTGYLIDAALEQLYKNALMYVFPSTNEGFGIPVLEAFSYDLPVLVADNTCLPEIGGDAVIQFDPYDTNDLSTKIKSVLNNEDLQKELISRGNNRLKQFSWHNAAMQLVDIFKKAV